MSVPIVFLKSFAFSPPPEPIPRPMPLFRFLRRMEFGHRNRHRQCCFLPCRKTGPPFEAHIQACWQCWQCLLRIIPDVGSVNKHFTLGGIVESGNQIDQCAFSACNRRPLPAFAPYLYNRPRSHDWRFHDNLQAHCHHFVNRRSYEFLRNKPLVFFPLARGGVEFIFDNKI